MGGIAACVALLALVGCGGGSSNHPQHDGGPDLRPDGAAGGDAPSDAGHDTTSTGDTGGCGHDALTKKPNGQACTCDGDCASNFCVDGLCCNSACNESCKTCSASDSMGTCTFLPSGMPPRTASACQAADKTTCGFDGTCDGAGGCRRYVAGTACAQGTCDGEAVVGSRTCDGLGHCRSGPTVICAPFSCDPTKGTCYDACTQSNQCAAGQQCVNGSCGKKMKNAACKTGAECASGFCADGVCCNVACTGGCVSCALPGRGGTCWPVDMNTVDPRGVCVDKGAASCGATGKCDGFGGCQKYPAETQCTMPSCTGTRRNTPGTCDGLGTCRPQGVQNCSPFNCADGACNKVCLSDKDCDSTHACVKGLCGLKPNGGACSAGTECLSTHCVDGVCCDSDCTGSCRSCALSSAPGKCTSIPAGNADPRGVCQDMTAASCSTNGKCDGAGGCQKYKMGTVCAPESCTANVYTPPSTCSSTGQCVAPDQLPCSPYTCNGTTCFQACTNTDNCLKPNVCNGNSCGLKNPGASCSSGAECLSTFCAQGVCCDKACNGSCQSCGMTGTLGVCTNVATGAPDPAGICQDLGPASCATNGMCQAGGCQKYPKGTPCKDPTCPTDTTTFTAGSTCDGSGACVTPAPSSCFPFTCGAKACKAACKADADCSAPAVCIAGSCGLKGAGKACADGSECLSKFCAQGVCCNSACNGSCQTCALPTSLGTCSNVPEGGVDPQGTCKNQGPSTCATDGLCDGKGTCRLFAAGTQCAKPSCPAGSSTLSPAKTCDGVGNCMAAATIGCAPYLCNATNTSACNAACTSDADCLAPNICDSKTNLCGDKKRLGQACTATSDCLTGNFCVDNVCCSASACGTCQACNVTGKAGSCSSVGAGDAEPHARCTPQPPCGNTGSCDGAGACAQASADVSCGTASCAGTTYTPVSHCTGGGACATAATSSCSPYVCGPGACKTSCTADSDCVAPYTCQGAAGAKSCALKKNGLACTTGGQCISGNCVDGVCCGSASCAPCQACNLSGTGACTPVAAGTAAPSSFCADEGASTCGANGKCDGAGGCQKYADGTACSVASCAAGSATLVMAGMCANGSCAKPTQSCSPYFCNGVNACLGTCSSDTDCASGYYCTGAGGACQPKKSNGQACAIGNQCSSNNCVDGVCCGSASCPSCQACNVQGSPGTCSPMIAGAVDPNGACVDQGAPSCGTNGKCDGAGGCQKYANGTTCSAATCANTSTLKLAGQCSNGACTANTQSCAPFLCTSGACANTCNTDNDCAEGTYCSGPGGTCVVKKSNGSACAASNQCAFGNCVDNVCCNTSCTASCYSCTLPNAPGICSPVPVSSADPKHVCTNQGVASCGTNGLCDGAGNCQVYAASTVCSAESCPAGTSNHTVAGTCETGVCNATSSPCDPYMCGSGGKCAASCTSDTQCTPGNYCSGGACVVKKDLGKVCDANNQCASGSCVDGVCCGSAACPQCQSCAMAGSLGACTMVEAGMNDPTGTCVDSGSIGCGTTGKCDAVGNCAFKDGSMMCAGKTCSGASALTSDRYCDGAGNCGPGTITDCGAFACDPSAAACFTTCSGDANCSAGNTCDPDTTSCIPS
ncbi:MAG TPA: hypothetical protein VHK47_19645 [Polyangia bacterium]|nr:hypothetical protein [Polyangia bacterium]